MRRIFVQQHDNHLLRWIVVSAVGLVVIHGLLFLIWGRGYVLIELPWFVPMMHSFMALASLSIAFLSFGRFKVLQEPGLFWIGVAFTGFALFSIFYVLSFPGLLPGGRGILGQLLNTASWFWHLQFTMLAVFLIVAALAYRPRGETTGRCWWLCLLAGIAFTGFIGWLLISIEQSLPILIVGEDWTYLNNIWNYILALMFLAGVVLSVRRYQQSRESLFRYVAFTQLIMVFAILTVNIGLRFYDIWWYWQRLLWIVGFSVMLFGLLSEYVGLYQEEREKSRELEALQRVTDPSLAKQGLEELLKTLLESMVSIMNAHTGAILLLDPDSQELVLRKGLGITAGQAIGLRVKIGEDFAGRVAAQNRVLWARDAQSDPSICSPYIQSTRVRGVIGAPMRIEKEVIGVVQVAFLKPKGFTPQEERLLEVVAERASLAIHQEKLLEETQDERNRLRTLIDTAPVGIIFYSSPDGSIELLNKAAETILGQRPRTGADITDLVTVFKASRPSGEPYALEELPASRALRGETCTGVEMLINQLSGRKVYLLVNSSPIRDVDGHIVGVVTAFQDITPIKEQERLRDEFLATASHELKTPVTTIKGYIQLLRQWAPKGHDPREGRAFDVINAQADRISQRVQEMLEVARFHTTPLALNRTRFDLGELVAQTVANARDTTEIHRITFRQDAPAPVDADRGRIEEVLIGLLDNAIRYSPKGGEIQVRVWAQDGKAMVSVKDQGVGISKDRQPHIFEPFYEPVPPGAPGYHGMIPLSLYLSKLIIERHSGHIWFESEEGKGSTFYFDLPLATDRSTTVEAKS